MSDEKQNHYIMLLTENLPILRAKLRLSQAELGELIGVTRQQIVAIENRKRKMSWSIFLSLVLLFSSRPATCELLHFYGIYSEHLFETIEFSNQDNIGLSLGRG